MQKSTDIIKDLSTKQESAQIELYYNLPTPSIGSEEEKKIGPEKPSVKKKKKKKKKLPDAQDFKQISVIENLTDPLAEPIYRLRFLLTDSKILVPFDPELPKKEDDLAIWTQWLKNYLDKPALPSFDFIYGLITKLFLLGNFARVWELYEIIIIFFTIKTPLINRLIFSCFQRNSPDLAISVYIDTIQFKQANDKTFFMLLKWATQEVDHEAAKKIHQQAAILKKTACLTSNVLEFKNIAKADSDEKKALPTEAEIEEVFNEVGLKETMMERMVQIRTTGGYNHGIASALIGFLLYNYPENAKKIILNDIDGIIPSQDIAMTSSLMEAKHSYSVKKSDKEKTWIQLELIVDGMPFDLTIADEKKYTGGQFVTNISCGKLSVFTQKEISELSDQTIVDRFHFLPYRGYYFGIDTKHPDYSKFRLACETMKYWFIDFNLKYLKLILKNQLFWERIRMDASPAAKNGEMINYPYLLINLPDYFFKEISITNPIQRQQKRNECYKALYKILDLVRFGHDHAKPFMTAMLKALILTKPEVQKIESAYCNDQLEILVNSVYDTLKIFFFNQDKPASPVALGHQLEDSVNQLFLKNKDSVLNFIFNLTPSVESNICTSAFINLERKMEGKDFEFNSIKQWISAEFNSIVEAATDTIPLINFSLVANYISDMFDNFHNDTEYKKLVQLSREGVALPDNEQPFILTLDEVLDGIFSVIERLLNSFDRALNSLDNNVYLPLTEICLKVMASFHNRISKNRSSLTFLSEIKEIISYLEKSRKLMKTAKEAKHKQSIGGLIYQKIDNLYRNKSLTPGDLEVHFLKIHVLPWINNDNNELKKQIATTIEYLFENLYILFLYFERGMLINAVGHSLDIYIKNQKQALGFLFRCLDYLQQCDIQRIKKLFKYRYNSDELIVIADMHLLDLKTVKASLNKDYERTEKITENKELLIKIKNLLFETTKIYHNYQNASCHSESFFNFSLINAETIIKIDEQIESANLDHQLLLPYLISFKFHILFNQIILNIKKTIRNPAIEIEKLAFFVRAFTVKSQFEKILQTKKSKANDPYFNNFNIISPLTQLAIGIQRLLHYTLLVCKNLINPTKYDIGLILEGIIFMMTAQNSIFTLIRQLEYNSLSSWLFIDKSNQVFSYSTASLNGRKDSPGRFALEIKSIHFVSDQILKNAIKSKELFIANKKTPSLILAALCKFIIDKLDELKNSLSQNMLALGSLNSNFFLNSKSVLEDLGLEDESKETTQKIQEELKNSVQEYHEALQAYDIKLNETIARLELETKSNVEKNCDELESEEKKLIRHVTEPVKVIKKSPKNKKAPSKKITKPPMHVPKSPVIYLYETAPSSNEETNAKWIEMRALFLQAKKLITHEAILDISEQIKEIIAQIEQYKKFNKNNLEIYIIKCWFIKDIHAHMAFYFIKKDCFTEASQAMEKANKEYTNICSIPDLARLKFKNLLEATLNHSDDLLQLFTKAKDLLQHKIQQELMQKINIINTNGIEWWEMQRLWNGYTDSLGFAHPKNLSNKALNFRKMVQCFMAVETSKTSWSNLKINLESTYQHFPRDNISHSGLLTAGLFENKQNFSAKSSSRQVSQNSFIH